MAVRIFVFNAGKAGKFISILIMVAIVITYVNVLTPGILEVSSHDAKILPIYRVDTEGSDISITFDCAWGAHDIPRILDLLSENNIKATFFVVGKWAEANPDAVKLIAEHGHEIGMHGYTHNKMGTMTGEEIKDEVIRSKEVIKKLTGIDACLFRAPYGDYSNNVVREVQKLGCYTIQWDVDSLDWMKHMTEKEIIERVLSKTKNGSIILFHNDTQHTVKAIPEIIKGLKHGGFNIVPVSRLIYKENYYIDFDGSQKLNKTIKREQI